MNCATEIKRATNVPMTAGKVRLMLGMATIITGIYFRLFSGGKLEGLGLLFLLVSPFIFITDKRKF